MVLTLSRASLLLLKESLIIFGGGHFTYSLSHAAETY